MLSICIPVYNHDLNALVSSLHEQGVNLNIPFEIILADDASEKNYRTQNIKLDQLDHVKYIQLDKNIGRAKIRNLLASKSSFQYLLFIDCDTIVPDDNYLKRYMPYLKKGIVVCGGTTYYNSLKNKQFRLRWLYGTKREEKTAKQRGKKPNRSFMTNNFLIHKELFNKYKLNETISGYGHEDTYFGYQLKKEGISIIHIDNPLIHVGLETSDVFLNKTREAIRNLLKAYKYTEHDKEFASMVSLLQAYSRVKQFKIAFFMRFGYKTFKNLMDKNLLGSKPKLWIFDLYKLGYICIAEDES